MPRNTAEAAFAVGAKTIAARRSDRFLLGLESFRSVTLVSHVHPDPDALGSMVGLAHLVETSLNIPAYLVADGSISRAENCAMIKALEIDLVPLEKHTWTPESAVIMVDSQPKTGRHSFNGEIPIFAVIDHHQTPGDLEHIPFQDVRCSLGATCSIVTRYLMEQDIDIPERVATCLYYGIETELAGYPREASPIDDGAMQFLFPHVNQDILAQIRNAPLPEAFFEAFLQALQSSFIYDKLMVSWINDLPNPELAAQVVDFMIRHEDIHWAMCAGIHDGRMILSMRTNLPRGRAGEILRQVAQKLGGRAGGHDRRAGGYIPLSSTSASAIDQLQSELRRRLLKALQIDETRGRRLVPRKEMLQNMV
jgi:nanoRNase/pAp phosphatase (c-di-AMP/oligoRNAs hydrolase)